MLEKFRPLSPLGKRDCTDDSKETRETQARKFVSAKALMLGTVILVCLSLCAVIVSCVETGNISVCQAHENADFIANGEEVVDPRIEINQPGFHLSNAVWLSPTDHIVVKWDRVNVHFTQKMEECHFENITSFNENCRICDLCGDANSDLCRFGPDILHDPMNLSFIPLKVRQGLSADGEIISEESIDPKDSCLHPAHDVVPMETSTYELFKPLVACDNPNAPSPPILSTPVHVIKPGSSESVKYELEKHGETKPARCGTGADPPCNTIWYRWTMPDSPVWSSITGASEMARGVRLHS